MKKFILLFPCSPLNGTKKVDEDFEREYEAALKAGFDIALFDHDALVSRGEISLGPIPEKSIVILRGWMLSMAQYEKLHAHLLGMHITMMTTPSDYELKHYWPKAYQAYSVLREMSPRCLWTEDKVFSPQHVKQFFNGASVVVKDHVKSAKGAEGAMFIKNSRKKEEVWSVVDKMLKERGPLFERGIVFKEKIDIRKDNNDQNIEMRLFFLRGRLLHASGNGCDYSRFMMPSDISTKLGSELGEGFYVVDLALDTNGTWRVLECGDGQVSGLTDRTDVGEFYRLFKWELARKEPGELDEEVLEDDHPVHWDYLYVVDGKVVLSDVKGSVRTLKESLRSRGWPAHEVTTCDIFGRQKKKEEV